MTRVPAHMVRQAHHERGRDAQVKLQAQDGGGDPTWFVREIRVRELTEGKHVQWSRGTSEASGSTEVMPGVQSLAVRVKRLWALAGFGS